MATVCFVLSFPQLILQLHIQSSAKHSHVKESNSLVNAPQNFYNSLKIER